MKQLLHQRMSSVHLLEHPSSRRPVESKPSENKLETLEAFDYEAETEDKLTHAIKHTVAMLFLSK